MAKLTAHRKTVEFFETLDKDKVETGKPEDESSDENDEDDADEVETDDEDDDDESDDESEDDKSETGDDDDDESEAAELDKKFPQLKGETLDEYKDSLETAYKESTTEGQRLKTLLDKAQPAIEALSKIVAQHPELAEEIGADATKAADDNQFPKDPTTELLKQQVNDLQKKEYDAFNEKLLEHGIDIEADAKLAGELNNSLALVRDHVWKSERRIVGMGEGLERAWKLMGQELDNSKDKVRKAVKKIAGQGLNSGGKKVDKGPELSETQRKIAEKYGLDPKKVARHITTD
jgi:hypothetical protein